MRSKVWLLLSVLVSWSALLAQPAIPESYSFEALVAQMQVQVLQKEYDIVLPVEERVPIAPSLRSLEAANWGKGFAGITENEEYIKSKAKRKVVVFVFDTADEYVHPDLQDFAWNSKGKQYTGEGRNDNDHFHSCHVAGIIGANGPAFDVGGARVLVDMGLLKGIPIEVLNDNGAGNFSWILQASEDALVESRKLQQQGYFVIWNYSLGGTGTYSPINELFDRAKAQGILVLAASGNDSRDGISTPANAPDALAIGASTQQGQRASFSNYGEGLEMIAPGVRITSTFPPNTYRDLSGTSMATPFQAGIYAILASIYPEATAEELIAMVRNAARDIAPDGWDKQTGYGYSFLTDILDDKPDNPPPPPPPPAPEPPKGPKRKQVYELPAYSFVWRAADGTAFETSSVEMVVQINTPYPTAATWEKLKAASDWFFTNRGLVLLPGDELEDANKWIQHFYKMLLRMQHDLDVEVEISIIESDAGARMISAPRFLENARSRWTQARNKGLLHSFRYTPAA